MRLINSMLVLRTENTMFSTMDITVLHLTTGMCDFMKGNFLRVPAHRSRKRPRNKLLPVTLGNPVGNHNYIVALIQLFLFYIVGYRQGLFGLCFPRGCKF